jgi:exodeoxyribonuclease V alpha subunit
MSAPRQRRILPAERQAEVQVLEMLGRRFGVQDPVVRRLVALTLRAAAAGHSCLDLALLDAQLLAGLEARRRLDERPARADEEDADDASGDRQVPDLVSALDALRASPVVHVVGDVLGVDGVRLVEPRPFVLSGTLLATHREYRAEQRVVDALLRRIHAAPPVAPLGAGRITEDPDQLRAITTLADAGVRAGIGVLVGGPGTGKTTTIAALLGARLAAHLAADVAADVAAGDEGRAPLRIALAAPTGKAAARLTEALQGALPRIAEAHGTEVATRLGALEATTVHRLLGIGRDGARRSDAPIAADLVIVDEASMLALPLAESLLDALPVASQLVLVGDPDQLESVDTGSVLRAMVDALPGAEEGGPVAQLRVNHRLLSDDAGRDAFIVAVRDGDAEAALEVLAARLPDSPSLAWIETEDPATEESAVMARLLDDGAGGGLIAAREAALEGRSAAAIAALSRVRLLCAHRSGRHGTSWWNARLRARLATETSGSRAAATAARNGTPGESWLAGEPVMVLANDERNGLVNGDTGVVVGPGASRRLVFARRDGTLLERPATVMPDVASAYAVTVHKSQGSEFDTVVVVLPPPTSPLATRELLYTAVTRARGGIVLVGSREAIRTSILRPSIRMGGLTQGLISVRTTLLRALDPAGVGVSDGDADGDGPTVGSPLTSPPSG